MLLGNYTPLNANPGRCITHAIPNPYKWRTGGNIYGFYTGDAVVSGETNKSSFPNGYVPPYTWTLAPKAGGLASINEIIGDSDLTASMAQGINIAATVEGVGSISTSNLSLVVSLISSIAGIGGLSASMVGTVQMAASLVGSGSVTSGLSLLANCIANLAGSGTVSSDLKGKSYMEAAIYVSQATATTEQLVYAIWNAIASQFNESGTMGEKLNGAGSAGDPWTTDLSTYNTAGTAGKRLKDTLTTSKFIGLK